MKLLCLLLCNILLLFVLNGCAVGHQDFVSSMDSEVGTKITFLKPFKFENSGELIRADFLIAGDGLTQITKDEKGNLIYHFSDQEILSNFHTKEWIGKCLFYYVVDPESNIIKGWAYDKGGNPLSCRTWP